MHKLFRFLPLCLLALLLAPSMHGQATYTATRATQIQVGVGGLRLNNDYSEHANYGISVFGDIDIRKFFGIIVGAEADAHFGSIITKDDIGENSYLIGPRFSYRRNKLNGYGRVGFGRATISNQLRNTSSSYNMYAFGGGIEYRITPKFNIRAVDVELQKWPTFSPRDLSPLAITVGVAYVFH